MCKSFERNIFIFFSVILIFFASYAPSFAMNINKLYIYRGRDTNTISNLINDFITKKKYYVYKADVSQGFFYVQPRYLGTYAQGDYIIAYVDKTEAGDSLLFTRCNYSSIAKLQIMLKYLQKNNCKYQILTDDNLINKYLGETNKKLSVKPISETKQGDNQQETLVSKVTQTETSTLTQQTKFFVPTNTPPKIAQVVKKQTSTKVPSPAKKTSLTTQKASVSADSSNFREISKAGLIFNKVNRGIVTVFSSVQHGSGFLIDNSGLILTNYHVVREQENELKVRFGQGEVIRAKVVTTDPTNDVAVIWVNLQNIKNYTVLPLFNPPKPEPLVVIGESILAVGSPLSWVDFEKTLTQGVVGKFENGIIMHDASVNHGNSGGPLINFGGYVVGINSFVPSADDKNGLSGAIAISRTFPSVDKAFSLTFTMQKPSPELLPDIPSVSYNLEIMKNEYNTNKYNGGVEVNKRDTPYIVNDWNYDVFIKTPPQEYRNMANEEEEVLTKHKKRLNKAGLNFSSDEYQSKNLPSLEYQSPLVQVLVIPKPQMTTGSAALGLLNLTAGILCAIASPSSSYGYYSPRTTYQYEFKKDFDKISLYNSSKNTELTAISSGKAPITQDILQYYSSQNIQLKDKSYIGLYEFDPKDFYNTDNIVLKIYSMDGKQPKTVQIPQKYKNYIVEDFMPYWNYIDNLKNRKN